MTGKENTVTASIGVQQNQTAFRAEQLVELLQSLAPQNLTRTKSGKGILLDDPLLTRMKALSKTSRLPQRNEIHTKALPFNTDVMAKYIDLSNCTYAVVEKSSPFGEAVRRKGVPLFADSAFALDSREHETDPWEEEENDFEDEAEEEEKAKKDKPYTTPQIPVGVHEMVFEHEDVAHRIVLLHQDIGEPKARSYEAPVAQSNFVFFTEGRRNLAPIQALAEKLIISMAEPPNKQNFHLFRWQHGCGYWKRISSEKARPMKSVILPVGLRESVELDMQRFLSKATRKWYDIRGIPYKRCYMFWGVPGTGKTSLITALAGRFRRNVCFLSAHHPKFTDEALKTALGRVPSRAIVVLEDIDSLFDKDRKTNNSMNPLTFTGLLNAVDGIGEHRGTIFVMTTNFIERLDAALIRAGRVDMKVEFTHADDYQLAEYFKWFYDDAPEEAEKLGPKFVEECRKMFPDGVTMAELQQHFVDNMHEDAETCIASLKNYDLPLLQRQALAELEKQRKKKEAEEKAKEKEDAEKAKADGAKEEGDEEPAKEEESDS